MTLLFAIIIGLIVGAAGGYFLFRNMETLLLSSVVGLVGSLFATVMYTAVGSSPTAEQLFTFAGILVAALGAVIAVLLFGGLQKIVAKTTAYKSRVERDIINKD